MDWEVPYIIFRHRGNGDFVEVFQTGDFKKAKYWLTYIAEVGDALCRTPHHPRYSGADALPEYWGHKEQSGSVCTDKSVYQKVVLAGADACFPAVPACSPDDYL